MAMPERITAQVPYIVSKPWVGGLLTNWKQVSKSISAFMEFSERFENFILQL